MDFLDEVTNSPKKKLIQKQYIKKSENDKYTIFSNSRKFQMIVRRNRKKAKIAGKKF